MMTIRFLWICVAVAAISSPVYANPSEVREWRTKMGSSIEAQLFAVYAGTAYFEGKRGQAVSVPIVALDAESTEAVRAWKVESDANATERLAMQESRASLTRFVRGRMVEPGPKRLTRIDVGERPEPAFYVFYYSASWCGPCRRFTPELVTFYKEMRERGYDNFEVFLVSSDRDVASMYQYMRDSEMPWPALNFSSRNARQVDRYSGRGIPFLAVADADGRLLESSHDVSAFATLSRLRAILTSLEPSGTDYVR